MSTIRQTIATEIKRAGHTQTELAELAGISQAALSRYLANKHDLRTARLSRLLAVLGLRLEVKRRKRRR